MQNLFCHYVSPSISLLPSCICDKVQEYNWELIKHTLLKYNKSTIANWHFPSIRRLLFYLLYFNIYLKPFTCFSSPNYIFFTYVEREYISHVHRETSTIFLLLCSCHISLSTMPVIFPFRFDYFCCFFFFIYYYYCFTNSQC